MEIPENRLHRYIGRERDNRGFETSGCPCGTILKISLEWFLSEGTYRNGSIVDTTKHNRQLRECGKIRGKFIAILHPIPVAFLTARSTILPFLRKNG